MELYIDVLWRRGKKRKNPECLLRRFFRQNILMCWKNKKTSEKNVDAYIVQELLIRVHQFNMISRIKLYRANHTAMLNPFPSLSGYRRPVHRLVTFDDKGELFLWCIPVQSEVTRVHCSVRQYTASKSGSSRWIYLPLHWMAQPAFPYWWVDDAWLILIDPSGWFYTFCRWGWQVIFIK